MTDMEPGATGVGKHVEDVKFWLSGVVVGGESFVGEPMLLPFGLDLVERIFFAEFRHNGGNYTGSGNFRQASVTDAVAFYSEVCFSIGGFTPKENYGNQM